MKWSTMGKGALKGLQFLYAHPEILEIAAASTGHPEIAAGISTVVKAARPRAATPPAPTPAPPAPADVVPVVEPAPPAVVPEVDLVGKWRGTLDRMAMDILGSRMAEDELYHNAQLLERGDVEGVRRNLEGKR